jgi:hypothetical protein
VNGRVAVFIQARGGDLRIHITEGETADWRGGVHAQARCWVVVLIRHLEEGQQESRKEVPQETRKDHVIGELLFFAECLVDVCLMLKKVGGRGRTVA